MSELATLVAGQAERLLADLATPAAVRAAEAGTWPAALWNAAVSAGLTLALVPEAAGGAGLAWTEAGAVLAALGRHAAPGPIAETMAANRLLARCGLPPSEEPLGLVDAALSLDGGGRAGPVLRGTARAVPWGRRVARLVATAVHDGRPCLVLIDRAGAGLEEAAGVSREPRDHFALDGVRPAAVVPLPDGLDLDAPRRFGALCRTGQMAGALDAALALAVAHAGTRQQFGRPIGRFQAVQQMLAALAGEAAAAAVAAQFACRHAEDGAALRAVATAKVRAGEAAGTGAALAHQVHGAIGFTDEYRLGHLTRRLWTWRDDFGSERHWAERLGELALAAGGDGLWDLLTGTEREG